MKLDFVGEKDYYLFITHRKVPGLEPHFKRHTWVTGKKDLKAQGNCPISQAEILRGQNLARLVSSDPSFPSKVRHLHALRGVGRSERELPRLYGLLQSRGLSASAVYTDMVWGGGGGGGVHLVPGLHQPSWGCWQGRPQSLLRGAVLWGSS